MRIACGTPCGDEIKTDTANAITVMLLSMQKAGVDVGWRCCKGIKPYTQNELITAAWGDKLDALLLIDSDMVFPPDTLLRLLAHNQPLVGCIYRARQAPYPALFGPLDGTTYGQDAGLLPVDYFPSGMMLMRRAVIAAVGYPWMEDYWGEQPSDTVMHDVHFCRKAQAVGIQPYVDFALSREVRHIASTHIHTGDIADHKPVVGGFDDDLRRGTGSGAGDDRSAPDAAA